VIRVVVADDQPIVRAGFHTILESAPDIEVVGEAEDGVQAVEMARELKPGVVLMDIRMPNMDGLEATRRIIAGSNGSQVRVLVVTTFDLDEYVYGALEAGASGFLLKDARRDRLIDAVRVVAAGEAMLAPSITKRLITHFARRTSSSELQRNDASDLLTPREREVMLLVAEGLSNAEIAGRLYLGEATVKSHVAHVLLKLGLRDRIQVVIHAYERGLVRPAR
jgi:DNA-binding NarL/FixJ family response regulator